MTESPKQKDTKPSKIKRPWWKRILRMLSRTILVLIILFIALVLFIRSPWGQDIIVGQVTTYISGKTKTKVSIEKLFISFSGDIELKGLYLEDKEQDTLIYSDHLQVEIPIWPIIIGEPVSVDGLVWSGLRCNIVRKDSITGYNYQFLIDAFASDTSNTETESSEPLKIFIGDVDLSDFKVNYIDEVAGTNANINLGNFHFEGKDFDLEKMKIQMAELALENTTLNYTQSKPIPPSPPSESPLPYLTLDNLMLSNVVVNYKSVPDKIDAQLNLAELLLQVPKADLHNQDIQIGQLALNNAIVKVKLGENEEFQTPPTVDTNLTTESIPFIWPNWNVTVSSIALQNNQINYQVGEEVVSNQEFNPDHIVLNNFNFKATDISLAKNQTAKISLEDISFAEASGLDLNKLSFIAAIDATNFSLDQLILETGNSSVNTDLSIFYSSIESLIEKPEEVTLKLDLNNFNVDINDAFRFQPALAENEYLKKLAKHNLTGQINASGKITEVNLSTFLVKWGANTKITTNGQLKNLTDVDNLVASIDNFTFNSNHSDLSNFVSEKELGIAIPKSVNLQSQLEGKLTDFKALVQLTIPEGKVKINGRFKQSDEIVFNAKVNVIDFKLGKVLKDTTIGKVAFEMLAVGNGKTINDLNAELTSKFSKLEFNGYNFSALKIDGKLVKGDGDLNLVYNDENLDLLIASQIQLDSISPKISVDFKLEGADLYALRLSEKQIRTKLMMNANFKGNSEVFNFESHITEGIAVYDEKNYHLGVLDLTSNVTKDSIALDVSSDFLNGLLRANAGIDQTISAVQNQLEHYFTDSLVALDSSGVPVRLQLNMKFSETNLISEFLAPDIKAMDTLIFNVDFNQKDNTLEANLSLPYLDYANNTIDSLQFNLSSSESTAKFKLGFNKLDASPILMTQTYFDGDFQKGLLNLHLHVLDGEEEFYVVKSEISGVLPDLNIHLNPEKLILNGKPWTILVDNGIMLSKETILAENFEMSQNNQSIRIANDLIQVGQDNIGIEFNNFKLANLLAFFSNKDLIAEGDLQGNVVAVNPLENIGLIADFNINNLTAFETLLGDLTLAAKSDNADKYNLNLGLIGDDLDLAIEGDYSMQDLGSELDFQLKLNTIGMKTIAALSGENLEDASGNISGDIAINGDVSAPDYKGFMQFNDAIFKVNELNAQFKLTNDKIKIDNTSITLNKFSIQDEQNNTFTLNGSLLTENLTDPTFDLSVKSKNFQVLNSTKKDNEVYYGSVNFDMNGTILGKMSAPIVDINIKINESTDFTYVLQDSQATLETTDGIVQFVNKTDPDNILTRANDSANIAMFGGIELAARLKIHNDAKFNIIIDPNTGDNLKVAGKGDLDFKIAKNGVSTLSGRYDINEGSYSLSLYNLVKREFELETGSSIVWRGGDPLDADMNVTAKYYIETSASALMASQISGSSEEIKNKYRQSLPFLVYLNVKGELDKPELTFNLGMPEDSQGAIDGTVYSRIKQLNTEEDALNKQVFSLLVLKKFYPNSGSDGSEGGAASLVRKNVNDALSDQLNAFSSRLTGNTGIELDFGLNSYTDYQGETEKQRTDLNISAEKKLLDDRLIVQVGSNVSVEGSASPGEENPVVGNVSIQYLLTKNGHWRLKGFRNSEYENVIDGQVYVNGISVLFQRQFNKFNELLTDKVEEPIKEDVEEDKALDEEKSEEKEEKTEEEFKKDKN